MTTKNIIKTDHLTLAQIKDIPATISNWLRFDKDYTFDMLLKEQTAAFAFALSPDYPPAVLMIEKLEWVCNYGGRVNYYDSDITVFVTAIVDLGCNKIVRVYYDLFDAMMMSDSSPRCSGFIRE